MHNYTLNLQLRETILLPCTLEWRTVGIWLQIVLNGFCELCKVIADFLREVLRKCYEIDTL